MSCVQLLQITLAEDIKPDSSTVKTLIDKFRCATDNVKTVWDAQHEKPNIIGIAAVWKSFESQKVWVDSNEGKAAKSNIQNLSTGPIYDDTVLLSDDSIMPTLGAKIVEIISWIHLTEKVEGKKEAIEQGFWYFHNAIIGGAPETEGGLVSGWGQAEFDFQGVLSKRFTLLMDWRSVEAHYACAEMKLFKENLH
ncbi:hypothetical protein F5Y19DRAFT_482352 [Xylariaceae sp. FL1651]|nr:hypothetical protein F5Y19DRAFT_482352 [Xylariaceae sp. FL1651]